MTGTQRMLYFMKKFGEHKIAIPADLRNDKPARIITELVGRRETKK